MAGGRGGGQQEESREREQRKWNPEISKARPAVTAASRSMDCLAAGKSITMPGG
jgi:hypothetical protein